MRAVIALQAMLLLLFYLNTQASELGDIEYITEDFPPYNFQEQGMAKGITVEVLLRAAKEAGQPISREDIYFRPWARGYSRVLSGPMVMLFAMARTPEREPHFQWVGPILQTRLVLLGRRAMGIHIKKPSDLHNYSIGVVRDDAGELLVKALTSGLKVQRSAKASDLLKKLAYERIDLMAYEETVARDLIQGQGLRNDDFQVVYVLKETISYFALSKDVPVSLVALLQKGLDSLKKKNQGRDYRSLLKGL